MGVIQYIKDLFRFNDEYSAFKQEDCSLYIRPKENSDPSSVFPSMFHAGILSTTDLMLGSNTLGFKNPEHGNISYSLDSLLAIIGPEHTLPESRQRRYVLKHEGIYKEFLGREIEDAEIEKLKQRYIKTADESTRRNIKKQISYARKKAGIAKFADITIDGTHYKGMLADEKSIERSDLDTILQEPITKKVIVGMSFNYSGNRASINSTIIKEAEAYRTRDLTVSHIIKRAVDDMIDEQPYDCLKHMFPVYDNVPSAAFMMMNLFRSDAEEVVFVGNDDVKALFDIFVEFFAVNKDYTRFKFVHEGKKQSLKNTYNRGKSALSHIGTHEPILFMSGDVPLFQDINALLYDADMLEHDVKIDFNTMQRIHSIAGEPFHRNYYHKGRLPSGELVNAKEPNMFMLKPNQTDDQLIWEFYGSRKAGGFHMDIILPKLINFSKLANPARAYKTARSALGFLWNFNPIYYLFQQKFNSFKHYLLNQEIPFAFAQEGTRALFNTQKVKLAFQHYDPFRVRDLDALEDHVWYCEVFNRHMDDVYAHASDIKRFAEHLQHKDYSNLVKNFKNIINTMLRTYSLPWHFNGRNYENIDERTKEQISIDSAHLHTVLETGKFFRSKCKKGLKRAA